MIGIWILMSAFIIWGIFLLNGKGTFLIAGYNTMSEEKKNKYDDNAVAKSASKMAFSIAFSIVLWILGDMYNSDRLVIFGSALTISIAIFFVIYFSKSKKLRKDFKY